jgi:xylulokinase
MDVSQRDWSSVMVESVGLSLGQLPELFEGPEITGALTTDAAGQTGLTVGTPVVAGAGDQAANAVGVGAVDSEIGALSMGTSGVVFVASEVPVVEPQGRIHSFCHAAPARWHAMGVILSAAGSLAWYRQTLAPDVPFGELVAEAGLVPPGSEGLRFLPYLTGERTPHSDPDAKGAFIGLTVRHERGHLTRAVMEGVAFGLADAHALIRSSGIEMPKVFNASGGGTRSRLWRQIVADVLRAEVATVKTVEGAAFGAALLAGVGAGWWGSVDKAVECVEPVDVVGPGPSAGEHQHAYESYVELYPALKGVFPRLN